MLTEKTIVIPVYKYRLRIVVVDSMDEIERKYPNIDTNSSLGMLIDYGDKAMMIVSPNNYSVIVHECEHAKNAIWKRIGFIPTPDNDEPDAYLLEYIFEETMKVVSKHLAAQC